MPDEMPRFLYNYTTVAVEHIYTRPQLGPGISSGKQAVVSFVGLSENAAYGLWNGSSRHDSQGVE
jgi:hypothetical protein